MGRRRDFAFFYSPQQMLSTIGGTARPRRLKLNLARIITALANRPGPRALGRSRDSPASTALMKEAPSLETAWEVVGGGARGCVKSSLITVPQGCPAFRKKVHSHFVQWSAASRWWCLCCLPRCPITRWPRGRSSCEVPVLVDTPLALGKLQRVWAGELLKDRWRTELITDSTKIARGHWSSGGMYFPFIVV